MISLGKNNSSGVIIIREKVFKSRRNIIMGSLIIKKYSLAIQILFLYSERINVALLRKV